MRKEEVWAVELSRIEEFFRQQPDAVETERGFFFAACRIVLTALPQKGEGFWRAPQTRIVLEGPEEDLNPIYRRFFLQFLSAGG